MLTIYGLPGCDSCRKARKWLEDNNIEYGFHDLRVDGVDKHMLERWCNAHGWKKLLNKRSTTWRGIPEAQRSGLSEEKALVLILENPTLVKRPVAEKGGAVLIGFTAAAYRDLFM